MNFKNFNYKCKKCGELVDRTERIEHHYTCDGKNESPDVIEDGFEVMIPPMRKKNKQS